MAQTIEVLEKRFPWHCAVLDAKGIAIPRIKDIPVPQLGDLAIGEDCLIYTFDGRDWR